MGRRMVLVRSEEEATKHPDRTFGRILGSAEFQVLSLSLYQVCQRWQERLLSFSDAFDKMRPSGLVQWWHDRRDMGRWWNYWLVVAGLVLTVLFGLVQSVTGVLQVIGVGGNS